MLLIVSEAVRGQRAVSDVIREMSFTPSYFGSPAAFAELMRGGARRVALLAEEDITKETLRALAAAKGRTPIGIIVAANRAALRGSDNAELVDRLAEFDNIEWVGTDFDFDRLSSSARRCRRP